MASSVSILPYNPSGSFISSGLILNYPVFEFTCAQCKKKENVDMRKESEWFYITFAKANGMEKNAPLSFCSVACFKEFLPKLVTRVMIEML